MLREQKAEAPRRISGESEREFLRRVRAYLGGAARERWRARVQPLLETTATRAGRAAAIAASVSLARLRPELLRYVDLTTGRMIVDVTDTTRRAVARAVRASFEARPGSAIREIVKAIESIPQFGRDRAVLIARTEVTKALNGAPRSALSREGRRSGTRFVKTWLTALDARVRDDHRELHGEQRGIDEAFSNGSQAPDEPNCRCTLIYSRVEAIDDGGD